MYDELGLYYHVPLNRRFLLKEKTIVYGYLQVDLQTGDIRRVFRNS
jgi:hypothetical protein